MTFITDDEPTQKKFAQLKISPVFKFYQPMPFITC